MTGTREGRADTLRVEWENAGFRAWLTLNNLPGLRCHFKLSMVAFFVARMFCIPYAATAIFLLKIRPFDPTNLILASRRFDGKAPDIKPACRDGRSTSPAARILRTSAGAHAAGISR